jgi:hypothetical protein
MVLNILPVVVELVTKAQIQLQDKIVMQMFCNPCTARIYRVFFLLPSSFFLLPSALCPLPSALTSLSSIAKS